MFKKIFRGVRNALKSPLGKLGLGALATLPFGGPGAVLGGLFSGQGALGKYGLPAILGLITSGALKGEEKEEAVSFDDFESQTSKKYGNKFGGSPYRGEQFLDLMFEPGSSQYFDYRNPQGILQNYQFDADDKIIERKKGGIAELNMGGNPFMDRQRISGSMGGGMNPGGYSPDPTIKSITGYNPLRAAQGSDVSVDSVRAQMNSNPQGIAQYFPRKFGMINGPGGPKEDKIPAMLSDGEFVFTAKAVDNAGGPKAMYNMMNKLDPESSKGRGIIS
jgi:hypothetical protein